MFSGIGGFELGIGDKCECIGYSEIDKYAIQIYQKQFPKHKNYGDATEINTDELPDFDLLVGGFPCQAFSVAGKRRGFGDTRGTLFFEIARIVKSKRPKTLLLENVKGLLSHNKGETFRVILQTLDELGYHTEWMVLNSKFFGVPQNRERVFIIGSLRGSGRPEILPFRESSENTLGERKISPCLDASYYKGTSPSHAKQGRPRPYVVAMRGRNPNNPSDRTTGSPTEQRLEPNSQGISNTLSSVTKDNLVLETAKIRRLTPLECERLQSFPDNWTAEGTEGKISDTQRYKCLGNAVTVNVIKSIIKNL